MNLTEFLEFEARDLEAEFAGVVADAATPRAIRRRRAVRAGATAGVAAVGVGAVALGGVRLAGWDAPEPGAADAAVAPSPDAVQALLIDPDADPQYSPWATVPACGQPAPAVVSEAAGLRVHLRSAPELTLTATGNVTSSDVRVSITNVSAPALLGQASAVGMVWVQDGTVVGYSASPYNSVPWYGDAMDIRGEALNMNVSGRVDAETYRCDSPAEGPWRTLAAGVYEAYPVVRVVGSVDSADGISRSAMDVTLVGEPLTVTLTSSWQEARAALDNSQGRDFPVNPQCGDPVNRATQYSEELWVSVFPVDETSAWNSLPEVGSAMSVYAGSARLVSPATLTFPETITVWYISAGQYGAGLEHSGPVISGRVTVRLEGSQEVRLTRNGLGETQLQGTVVESEPCASNPGAFPRNTVDVVVTWSDIEGEREVSNVPG
jgi:hypothetical protein